MAEIKDDYSSIVSIIYFTINMIFLIALGVIVYNQGAHEIISKSYFKDIWNQRKIYAPIIIHFYDTATDIGVVYSWFVRMRDEHDYESVDMAVFFWTGISFLALYRLCLLCWTIYDWSDAKWYHLLLILLDLYIFVTVYESFMDAQGIITENARKRRNNTVKKLKQRSEKTTEEEIEPTKNAEKKLKQRAEKITKPVQFDVEEEIEPAEKQFLVQLCEAIFESMPQIVLQSVFVIRSENETMLQNGSNIYLIMFSVIASLLSISNKFVFMDKEQVSSTAGALKPREHFPDCIQYWYVVRVIWRMFHIMARFCIFVLIWVILGGTWLPIWIICVGTYWFTIYRKLIRKIDPHKFHGAKSVFGTISCIGTYFEADLSAYTESVLLISCVFIQNVIGLGLITIFGVFSFECGICADPNTRQVFDNTNNRVLIFWTLGVVSVAMDVILFLVMRNQNIFYPAYIFLKTEACTMISDGNSKENFKKIMGSCSNSYLYVYGYRMDKIFESIKENNDKSEFTREEYMNWVQSLTPHKLYFVLPSTLSYDDNIKLSAFKL
eukprot:797280_1